MAKSMERVLAEIAGHEIFVDKISCLLNGLQESIHAVGDHELAKHIPTEFTTHIHSVFERFERNRNKIQIALQNVGPTPEPETNIEPAAEEPPEPTKKSTHEKSTHEKSSASHRGSR